jgi:hypothetical protein
VLSLWLYSVEREGLSCLSKFYKINAQNFAVKGMYQVLPIGGFSLKLSLLIYTYIYKIDLT